MTESDELSAERVAVPPAGAEAGQDYLELYKLAVEMADRVSARRGLANTFFLTANTAVAGVLGTQDVRWYLAVAGIVLSMTWWTLLKAYGDLNRAKFQIILSMEERLPVQIYGEEWNRLHGSVVASWRSVEGIKRSLAAYRELGRVERLIPWVFVVIYVVDIVRQSLR